MQGACTKPPPPAAAKPDLATVLPNQCVIQTAGKLFSFKNDGVKREPWLGNLYIRLSRQAGQNGTLIEWTVAPKSQLWMTNVTLQGDGKEGSNGIAAKNGPILMASAFRLLLLLLLRDVWERSAPIERQPR
jgi:hypothetical protein